MLRTAPTTAGHVKSAAPACRATLLKPIAARRVAVWSSSPSNNGKEAEHHSLISVWEDKEIAESEEVTLKVPSPPATGEKQSLVSVWENHELAEEEKKAKEAKENSLLNHPTGKQQAGSSYDSM